MGTRIVIIGGVAGGASAAARARRLSEDAEIILIERGGHISFANCGLPYYLGGTTPDRDMLLVQTPEGMKSEFNVDVRILTEATGIQPDAQTVSIRDLVGGGTSELHYDKLILSTGAAAFVPPMPGSENVKIHVIKSLEDTDTLKDELDGIQTALVIGGGPIGLEMAENLVHAGKAVHLVELADQVFAPVDKEMATPLHQHLQLNGVELHLDDTVAQFTQGEDAIEVQLRSGVSLDVDIVISAVGVRPESELARDAGLTIGDSGGIVVDPGMRTSDAHIYAVGDVVESTSLISGGAAVVPLAGAANRQGRIAADNIFGMEKAFKGTVAANICKVFDLAVATVGHSEKFLKKAGIDHVRVYTSPNTHAGCYPGASRLDIKMAYSPETEKILGAQIVGFDGVDKRIDVISSAIQAGMSVRDLSVLELAYAPPFSSAKDPVNHLGYVAENVLDGLCKIVAPDEVDDQGGTLLLDVRTDTERGIDKIEGSDHIPLQVLRERLDELPKDKPIVVYCAQGIRGYNACRILTQRGFDAHNLSGGLRAWELFFPQDEPEAVLVPQRSQESPSPSEQGEIIDAIGLSCPGPIVKLQKHIDAMSPGEFATVKANDTAFIRDLPKWSERTGNTVVSTSYESEGAYSVVVQKNPGEGATEKEAVMDSFDEWDTPDGDDRAAPPSPAEPESNRAEEKKVFFITTDDYKKVTAALMLACVAASAGDEVTLFFIFDGIKILRKEANSLDGESEMLQKFGKWGYLKRWGDSNPCSDGTCTLLAMNDYISVLQDMEAKFVVCVMALELLGLTTDDLIDGVEEGGIMSYLHDADDSYFNMFI